MLGTPLGTRLLEQHQLIFMLIWNEWEYIRGPDNIGPYQCYKTFCGHKLRIFVIW
jgi:hypothetical protein